MCHVCRTVILDIDCEVDLEVMANHIRQYLTDEAFFKMQNRVVRDVDLQQVVATVDDWSLTLMTDIPLQTNGTDCGMFLLM